MTTYAIECQGLSKVYRRGGKKFPAVANLNLHIEARQVYGFLGPNGAGKTTTIRMLLNLIRPSDGEVRLFGEPVRRNPIALKNVGALVEGANFYPYLSGWDNLRVLAWSLGKFDEMRARQVLEAVGLTGREHDKVGKYSTGMQQRLGIAAALLHNPQLVILDEPTNGLDPAALHAMRKFIRDLVDQEGKTVFLSSHLLSEVQQVCDRVAIIHQGQLLAEGRVVELLKQESGQLLIEVDPLAAAHQALAPQWEVQQNPDAPNRLLVTVTRDEIPEVVKTLVDAEVKLYAMQHRQPSLEEFFLSVTASDEPSINQMAGV